MTSRATWVFMTGALAPLSYVYLSFLYWLYHNPRFFPATTVEMAILGTQLLRLLVVLAVPRFRRASFVLIIDVFSVDLVASIIFILLSVTYSDAYFLNVAGQIIWTWPPAALIALLPFAMFRLASKMRGGAALSVTIPSAAAIFVTLTFLASATTSYTQFDGLMGISKLLLAAIFGSILTPSIPYDVTVAGTALFLVMIVYAVSQGTAAQSALSRLLSLGVAGAAVAVGWELAASSLTHSELWVFGVPALGLVGLIWGITHAR